MKTRTIAVFGYYGMSNFGDDLFCTIATEQAGEIWPGTRVLVVGPQLHSTVGRFLVPRFLAAAWRRPGPVGIAVRLLISTFAILRASDAVYFGGSVLSTPSGVQQFQFLLLRLLRRRVCALGVSIGPFTDEKSRNQVHRILRESTNVVVRDAQSSLVAETLGITATYGGDLAALYNGAAPEPRSSGYVLGVIPCKTATVSEDQFIETVSKVCERLQKEVDDLTVRVLTLNTHPQAGDTQFAQRLLFELQARDIRVAEHAHATQVEVTWNMIAGCDEIWSIRLHGAIVAYLAKVPFLLTNYHSKCRDFVAGVPPEAGLLISPDATPDEIYEGRSKIEDVRLRASGSEKYVARARAAYLDLDR